MIDAAEDRERFQKILERARSASAAERYRHAILKVPRGGCNRIGYPVLVRPSYVLGGRAMEICYDQQTSGIAT